MKKRRNTLIAFSLAAILPLTTLQGDVPKQTKTSKNSPPQDQDLRGIYNASASYKPRNPWNVFASADFLYWQTKEDNIEYGITTVNASTTPFLNGKVLNMNSRWHPGLKLALGGDFTNLDNWDLLSEWTHLISHNGRSSVEPNPPSGAIYPTFLAPDFVTTNNTASVKANWKLNYNTVDLNLGRPLYSGKRFKLRPHGGLRGAWFNQKVQANYFQTVTATIQDTWVYRTKFDSWGIGPRLGFLSDFMLGKGFRIFGSSAFSLLFTYFDVNQKYRRTRSTSGGPPVTLSYSAVKNKKRNSQIRSNLEAALGLGWGSYFNSNRWHFDLALGYEFQYWPDANKNLRFVDDTDEGLFFSDGNLGLHGLTVKLRLDF